MDLRPLAEQLVQIAEKLRGVGIEEAGNERPGQRLGLVSEIIPVSSQLHLESKSTSLEECRKIYAEMARETYAQRRKRASIFKDPELFGEPGWDILLDLYIAQVEGKPVSVSSACIGSASPPTTGLRWLGVLADQGLVLREHDPEDQRRVLVRLTDKAMEAMDVYFSSSASSKGDRRAARA